MPHTPGPWVAVRDTGDDFDSVGNMYWRVASQEMHVDTRWLDLSSWMSEANARLIAASPDLLEALQKERSLVEDAQYILTQHLKPDGRSAEKTIESLLQLFDSPHQRAIKAATDAAIAKATEATP